MLRITRKFGFDAGHRILGHESKCAHLHGHRYVAEVTVSAVGLDTLSRVVDFGVIKNVVGEWIDANWDHNMLLHMDDPLLQAVAMDETGHLSSEAIFGGKVPFIIPHNENPTAEVMAQLLFTEACVLLCNRDVIVERVRLYETPNCWADYIAEGL